MCASGVVACLTAPGYWNLLTESYWANPVKYTQGLHKVVYL